MLNTPAQDDTRWVTGTPPVLGRAPGHVGGRGPRAKTTATATATAKPADPLRCSHDRTPTSCEDCVQAAALDDPRRAATVLLAFGDDDKLHILLDDGLEESMAYVRSRMTSGTVQEEENARSRPVLVAWSGVQYATFKRQGEA